MTYPELLQRKVLTAPVYGHEVLPDTLHPALKDFQRIAVTTALRKGRYALFHECGLGKTFQQLEWADQVARHESGGYVLILAPLAVKAQTIAEGQKWGYPVSDVGNIKSPIHVANYDQLHNIDTSIYAGVVLDESSILKSFNGRTKKALEDAFRDTPYRLCCTATPSPNDVMELGNHAQFLGIMDANKMLAMFFVHDGGETQKWRLKGHARADFWRWVATWSMAIVNPGDIGCDGAGYVLPELTYHNHIVKASTPGAGKLFSDTAVSATQFAAELRRTQKDRLQIAADIANTTDKQVILWVRLNDEGTELLRLVPDAIEVSGTDSASSKESKLLAFARGEHRVLITKEKISGMGMNFQNCHIQVFASLSFSFEGLYQSIRRSYRFGQIHPVQIHLITTDTMENVETSINRKAAEFETMRNELAKQTAQNFVLHPAAQSQSKYAVERGQNWEMHLGDCVEVIQQMPDRCFDISVFSPPFADLYVYSNDSRDMGNNDFDGFVAQFSFLVKELARTIKPGRICAVHCMDLPIQKGKEGYIGLRDFSGVILKEFEANGFVYHSRVTIWKNPVTEMQRTKALGLLHKQVKKDSTMSRVGIPDYVLLFRNAGENEVPITTDIPVDLWQEWASPVWMDIDYGDTLNKANAREENDERHIAPLQLPTIERLVSLYSNPGETVFSPFGGIGSEPYQSVLLGRKAVAIELKESYWKQACKFLRQAEVQMAQGKLF